MDSFFSLFDPSDGQSQPKKTSKYNTKDDNVKKKDDATTPKGRRRGRKAQGKNETLPEESSFLCEPDLSMELLVKDGSYIESYIEVNKKDEDAKDSDLKPKRRNSSRKNRRKKKVSPSSDLVPGNGWSQETGLDDTDTDTSNCMNNQVCVPKSYVDDLGKNVNDLNNFKRGKRKNSKDTSEQRAVYNVIDKFEKVGLKDDMYLAGEFSTEELENDMFYNSDEMDESFDDTSSEAEDSSSSSYGCLPPEPRFGNVEYKLRLVSVCERRFQHLVTQLKWRLRSGGGSAVYVLGVRDCGALVGLRARALRASLVTLLRMARALRATVAHCTPRRVAPHRAVAEVYIRKLADTQQSEELRVAVLGANEAGKSTLIGVLTQGELDNGRGSARLNMFRHLHEVKSGQTSSLSHEILGFDAQGNVVNYGCSELMTAERIGERSAKLVSFLDLAGHTKYQRTTLHGLTGYSPHYAMIVISATAGITPITEEHLGLLCALEMPFSVVVAKCELAPTAVPGLVRALAKLLPNKKPLVISDESMARNCVAPNKSILDSIDDRDTNDQQCCHVPVFPVSCVRGFGLRALHAYLLALTNRDTRTEETDTEDDETCEFQIDEIFHVGQSSGPVVGGLLARGVLEEGDQLIIGPLDSGEFVPCLVRTIYRNRVPHGAVRAGHSASLGLSHSPPGLRAGMVLLSWPSAVTLGLRPSFGGCEPGTCTRKKQVKEILDNKKHHDNAKNRKNVRRKNKNLLSDLAKVENSLHKDNNIIKQSNIYHSDNDDKVVHKRCDTDKHFVHKCDTKVHNVNICDTENNFVKRRDIERNLIKNGETENNFVKSRDTESDFVKKCNTEDHFVKKRDTEDDFVDRSEAEQGLELDSVKEKSDDENCGCCNEVFLEDPNNPRGCIYFQATVHVLRHSTAICPGFQCSVHVGNVRQTAIIEGIMSRNNEVRAGQTASAVFRFARCPEYLVRGRRMLLTAGLGTRAIGRITQIFPYYP